MMMADRWTMAHCWITFDRRMNFDRRMTFGRWVTVGRWIDGGWTVGRLLRVDRWMTIGRWVTASVAALALSACAGGDAPSPDGATDSLAASASAAPSSASPNGTPADSAVAAATARERRPVVEAQDTGYTAWRALEMPSEPWSQRAADPQALLTLVRDVAAAQLEEPDAAVLPTRMLSESADSATGLLVHPDLADDSIRDVEFRLHMRREGGEWTVAAVERRERCRRGVAEGGLCL